MLGKVIQMTHLAHDHSKLLDRVHRIKGQVEGIERAFAREKNCAEILQQIAAVRGAINGLMAEVVVDHIRFHVAHPGITDPVERATGASELIDVIQKYMK